MLPTISYAQDTIFPPVPLKQGDPAPVNGVLVPTVRAAEITAQLEQQEQLCNIRVSTEVAITANALDLRLNNCNSSRLVMEEMYATQLTSQREYIDFLEKKAMGPKIPQEWIFIIGIAAGVGITIGAGYAMHQAASH